LLDNESDWEAMSDINRCDGSAVDAVQMLKQLDDLSPQDEVFSSQFGPRTGFGAEFDVLDHPRRRGESRISSRISNCSMRPKFSRCIDSSSRWRPGDKVAFVEKLCIPCSCIELEGEPGKEGEFGQLDIRSARFVSHRQGNAFKKKALQSV
jgi:hypothetical protein